MRTRVLCGGHIAAVSPSVRLLIARLVSYSLNVFGGASIEGPDGPVTGRAAQRHRLGLLALLAVSPRGMNRDKLVALLWPERKPERARHALSDSIYRINRALDDEVVVTAGDELRLDADVLPSDLAAFRAALETEDWERATAIYGGPFLDGFHLSDAPEFERWLHGERQRLARRYAEALEALAEAHAARGDPMSAVEAWRRRAAHDRYDARVAVRLMEALEAAGNPAAALRHARVHARLLEEEFGAGPDPDVQALAERIRAAPGGRSGSLADRPEQGARPQGREKASGSSDEPSPPPAPEDQGTRRGDDRPAMDADDSGTGRAPDRAVVRGPRPWTWIALGAVGVLVLILVGAWIRGGSPSGPGSASDERLPALDAEAPTIAVLPMEPLGVGPDVETWAHAIHSDVITALSKLGRFTVIQRSSTLDYGPERERSPVRAASELGADFIVEGDIRQARDLMRVNVRLSDARTGDVLWADNMDSRFTMTDVFTLQTNIVERIVGALERSLTPRERERMAAPPTDEPSAWQYFHQAQAAFDGTRAGNVEQERLLRRALQVDPTFAEALASLAVTYAWRPLWTGMPTSAWDSAVALAERALEEDPENGTAYAALSDVYGNEGFVERAIRTARTAVDLNPNSDLAAHRLGRPLHESGRFVEGLRYLEAAAVLSPNRSHYWAWAGHARLDLGDLRGARRLYRHTLSLAPEDWQGLEGLAWTHLLQGDPDSALAWAERLARTHPEQPGPLASSGMIALFAGDDRRADSTLRRVVELAPEAPVHARSTTLVRTMLGYLRFRDGDTVAADTLFERSVNLVNGLIGAGATAPRWPYERAQVAAARGRVDVALEWLERAYAAGFRWGWMLELNPLLDPLREDLRFRGLLERIGSDVDAMRRSVPRSGFVEPGGPGGSGESPEY